jgi:predicted nucleic acid-binding protein
VVIADAGPLIGLARIGCLDLLRALFGGVTLTAVVAVEIGIDPRPGASAIAEALAAGWLSIASPSGLPDIEPLNPGVDPGERSTIALALHRRAAGENVLVIMDDRCGRAEARSRGALDPWHRCRYGLGEGAAADSRLRAAAGGSA